MTNTFQLLQIDLIKELGLESLPAEERQTILSEMEQLISERILVAGMQQLSDEQMDAVDEIDDPNKVVEYLNSNVPNFQLLVADEVANFKSELLAMNQIASEELAKKI